MRNFYLKEYSAYHLYNLRTVFPTQLWILILPLLVVIFYLFDSRKKLTILRAKNLIFKSYNEKLWQYMFFNQYEICTIIDSNYFGNDQFVSCFSLKNDLSKIQISSTQNCSFLFL